MSLDKSCLAIAIVLAISGCTSSSSSSSRDSGTDTPLVGAAQPTIEQGATASPATGGTQTGDQSNSEVNAVNAEETSSVDGASSNAGSTSTQDSTSTAGNTSNSGESAVGVTSNTSSAIGSGYSEFIDFGVDPTSPDFVESDSRFFRTAVLGAWAGTDCRQVNSIFSTTESLRTVFVFTQTQLIESEYVYNSLDCSGIPSSKWYPLPIRSWNLGQYRTLSDGSNVWELDTTVTQRGVYAGDIDEDLGTDSYVNIDFVDGKLEFNTLVENYKITRPAVRSGRYFEKLQGRGLADINAAALAGRWKASCTGRLESTYEFYADSLIITDENWADVGCEGDSYAVRKTTFNLDYGDPFTSVFGNHLIAIKLTAVSNELLKFDTSQGLDEPEFKVQEGKTEFRAVSIDENTLILAYCLYRNSGEDDCQDSEERTPDMVDHNWAVRFDKVL